MRKNQWNNRVLTACLLTAFAAIPASAETERTLEEVVVTAQKRANSVQDVPISIAVVSGDDLRSLALFDFTETAQVTPGIALNSGLQAAAIRLRGVGPGYFALGQPQSVTVFVDEVAQAQIGAVFTTLVDIERLELLRGPQGTLYGQNAPGGAYNISTRAPDMSGVHGYIEASYSHWDSNQEPKLDTRGAINIPIIEDRLAARLAAVYTQTDGFIDMQSPRTDESASGGQEVQALRSRMLWQVNESLELNWTTNYQDITQYQEPFNFSGILPGTGGANITAAIGNRFKDRKGFGDFRSEVTGDLVDSSLRLQWSQDSSQLTAIAYHQRFDTQSDDNREPFPGGLGIFQIGLDSQLSTFELRFGSELEAFSYLTGIYYLSSESISDTQVTLQGIDVVQAAKGTTEGYAAFVNGTVHLHPQWDLTVGARYDYNETSLDSNVGFLDFAGAIDDTVDFDHISWSLKLQHALSENLNVYAAIDNAYKQGGFNTLTSAALQFDDIFPLQAATARDVVPIKEEVSTAFEIGAKGTALNDTLRFSAAIFYQEFEDHQLTQPNRVVALTPLEGLFEGAIVNADEVITQGIEWDVTYLVNDHWDIALSGAYSDPTIESWPGRFCKGGEEQTPTQLFCPQGGGQALNSLPRWNTNAQAGYQQSVLNNWVAYARANWTWQSKANSPINTTAFSTDKHLLSANMGMRHEDTGLDVRIWVKNLTNEDFNIDPAERANGDPALAPAWEGTYWPSREYGITVLYSF
ncbi:MAG: TonB-dependent receptor [Halioglobus sp.]